VPGRTLNVEENAWGCLVGMVLVSPQRQMEIAGYMPKSKTDKWATPPDVYDPLHAEFQFNYDPCPITWTEGDTDGLAADWGTCSFVNPPYSKVAKWIAKAHTEWKKGKTVVMLINAITDTKAFHEFIYRQAEVRFIKGRIKFIDPTQPDKRQPSPKPSMLVIFQAAKTESR